jgi:hypothetical protein
MLTLKMFASRIGRETYGGVCRMKQMTTLLGDSWRDYMSVRHIEKDSSIDPSKAIYQIMKVKLSKTQGISSHFSPSFDLPTLQPVFVIPMLVPVVLHLPINGHKTIHRCVQQDGVFLKDTTVISSTIPGMLNRALCLVRYN